MIKVVLNLSNDPLIVNSIEGFFKGVSNKNSSEKIETNIDSLINKISDAKTVFMNDFSKCVCDDKDGWTIAVCVLDDNSSDLRKIHDLYANLTKICSEQTYLLVVFQNRDTAAKVAWQNSSDCIDIQVKPKNNDWSVIFQNICKHIEKKNKLLYLRNREVILYGYKPYAGSSYVEMNYVCDTSCHGNININKKILPVISLEEMLEKKNAYVLIGVVEQKHRTQAVELLKSKGIEYDFLDNYVVKPAMIYLDYLVNHSLVCYRDMWDNKFIYAGNRPYKMAINIQPFSLDRRMSANKVYIGRNFECSMPQNSYLRLRSPENYVFIADNVKFVSAEIIVSGAQSVIIHEDTLIARNAILRCEISHPLFDGKTKKVLEQKRNIVIGRHVWCGEECYLLSGAVIGDGAVMGARSLTSGHIEGNSVAVGAPAKVIKRDVIWAKDNFDLECKKTIYDCVDQDGLKYYEYSERKG